MVIDTELKDFLNSLVYFKIGKKTFAMGKVIPYLFEVPSRFPFIYSNNIRARVKKDYLLLKGLGYISNHNNLQRKKTAVRHLGLHVSHACNMACAYCFGKHGSWGSKVKIMSPEIAKKAIRFFSNCSPDSTKKVEIVFIGGEPLLNLPAIKAAVKETRNFPDYDFKLKIATNGTIINKEIIQFLKKNKIQVGCSYDGQEHDRHRVFKDGRATSEIILRNLNLLRRNNISIMGIKACLSKNSPFSFTDVAKNLMKLPIHPREIRISHECTFPPRLLRKNQFTDELGFYNQLHKWIKKGKKLRDLPLSGQEEWLDLFVQARKRPLHFCGFNRDSFLVVPNGDIYFCDLNINIEKFKVGNIHKGIEDKKIKEFMKNYVLRFPRKCSTCYLKGICSYHCMFTRKQKELLTKRCEFTRKKFKKFLEIFLNLDADDVASIYYHIRPRSKEKLIKQISYGYKLRSILQKNTTFLRPINILPQYESTKN